MRRLLRVTLVVTLGLGLVAVATGVGLVRARRAGFAQEAQPDAPGAVLAAHAVAGHALTLAAALAASLALVLGLQRVLEPRGPRRVAGGLMAILSPVLMGLALACDVTGFQQWDEIQVEHVAEASFAGFVRLHAVRLTLALAAVAACMAGLAAWALPARPDEEEV